MTDYVLKDSQHYKNIKKLYNFEPLTVVWHNEGAPSSKIGKCVDSFKEWFANSTDTSLNSFCQYYLEHTKSVEEFEQTALNLQRCFAQYKTTFIGKEDKILDLNNIFDLIIFHAIVETYNGVFAEEEVKRYLEKDKSRKVIKVEELDRLYGIDLLAENQDGVGMVGVQVKPVSFFLGKKSDLIKDRQKVFTQFDKLIKNKNKYNVDKLFFVIYKTDGNETLFLNVGNKFFYQFVDYNNMMSCDWVKICNDSNNWKKIRDEVSRQ